MRSMAIPFVLACLVAAPAAADVTIVSTASGKAAMIDLGGKQTMRLKGNKLRFDSARGDNETSMILDIDGQRMVMLDAKKKEATVVPIAQIQEKVVKVSPGEVKISVTPTAETKTVAGLSCKVHNVSVAVPFTMGGNAEMAMTMSMTGPACLSKEAPGQAEFAHFWAQAAEKGFIMGDPRALQGPGGAQQRSLTQAYRAMTDIGIALEQSMTIGATGEGPMAAIMNRMGKMTITTVVDSIQAGDLAADIFEIPAGYKVKQN
jgi:hypothetical protein